MSAATRHQLWHGDAQPPPEPVTLRAGPLAAELDGVDLRYVRLGDVELVRRIYAAVRDRNWNTVSGTPTRIDIEACDESFRVVVAVRHESAGIDFSWEAEITGTPEGRISYSFGGRAGRALVYNRIGFCVLHPFREAAGRRFRGLGPGGEVRGELPRMIGPQGFEDGVYVPLFPPVSELEIELESGGRVRFEFEGDLFEMEDQRNWTDASFKSYCTPLSLGFPHELAAADRIRQCVRVAVEDAASSLSDDAGARQRPGGSVEPLLDVGGPVGRRLPSLGLMRAVNGAPLGGRELELLTALRLDHLRVDVCLSESNWEEDLALGLDEADQLRLMPELALFVAPDDAHALDRLAPRLADRQIARVLVVRAGGESATPDETTPASLVRLVRDRLAPRLGGVPIAGGTDMYFCELNRTRPDVEAMDGVFYSIVPQVHAFDDLSLVETLEAQAETIRSAAALADGRPVIVSPITLRRRFNPHATAPEAERSPHELPDSVDPRQLSLLGAAWTVGSVKQLAEAGAASLTYFETVGWRGVVEREQGPQLPPAFPSRPAQAFPVYHVLADLAERRRAELLACETSDLLAVTGLALRTDTGTALFVANLGSRSRRVRLSGIEAPRRIRRLREDTAEMAAADPLAFRAEYTDAAGRGAVELAPFETVLLET